MSYLDLWDKFKEVRDHWTETRSICDEFTRFITEKSSLDKNYAKGLKKLLKNDLFNHDTTTLLPCLSAVKNLYKQNAIQLKILAENFQTDLAQPFKQLISHQDLLIKEKLETGKKLINDREKTIKSHDRAKERYFKELKEADSSKSKGNLAAKFEENYKNEIEMLNNCNKGYVEGMRKVLFVFQQQEEERLRMLKDCLRKIVIYEISYMRSSQYELDSLPNVMESFNPQADLKKFVDDNITVTGIETVKFMPYLPPTPRESMKSQNNKNELMNTILEKCWKGEDISREEGTRFVWAISDNEGKKVWVNLLGNFHSQNNSIIPESTFNTLGDLMWCTFSSMMETQDYYYAKDCIFFTQLLYTENEEKKFLYEFLISHPLWQDEYNWEKIIATAINQEIENYMKHKESIKEEASMDKVIIVSQLTWFGRIMKLLQVEEASAQRLLDLFTERYQLTENIPL